MDDRDDRPGRLGPTGRVVTEAVVLAGLWLVFAGSLARGELVAAVAVGIVGAATSALLRRFVGHRHRAARRWLRHGPALVAGALADCWLVTRELVRLVRGRPPRSALRRLPFAVGDDRADDVGRRVLTTLGLTLQPNSVVLGYDEEHQQVLVHELVPGPTSPVPDELARPT